MGGGGSLGFYKNLQVERPAFLHQNTIETTGAGDTCFGSIINFVLEYGLGNLSEANLVDMLTFANAAAPLITTKKGALRVMPEKTGSVRFYKKFSVKRGVIKLMPENQFYKERYRPQFHFSPENN